VAPKFGPFPFGLSKKTLRIQSQKNLWNPSKGPIKSLNVQGSSKKGPFLVITTLYYPPFAEVSKRILLKPQFPPNYSKKEPSPQENGFNLGGKTFSKPLITWKNLWKFPQKFTPKFLLSNLSTQKGRFLKSPCL